MLKLMPPKLKFDGAVLKVRLDELKFFQLKFWGLGRVPPKRLGTRARSSRTIGDQGAFPLRDYKRFVCCDA